MKKIFRYSSFILLLCTAISAHAQNALGTYDTLQVGGIQQVVWLKGKPGAPLLLCLHGGPGSSRMAQADKFSDKLQQYFTVVQWDQRETGKTLTLNATKGAISLQLMEQDTYEMVKALLKKSGQRKLYLAGESWGTVPGFYMAAKHPELLYAYLAFSPVIDQQRSESMLLDMLQQDAVAKGNTQEQQELATVKVPFEDYMQLYYSRKWLFHYNGEAIADSDTAQLKTYLQSWATTWLPTWTSATRQNLFKSLPTVKCPVYFFIGGMDNQTNCSIAKEYYNALKAPQKKLYWFDDAGHSVLVTDAAAVQQKIIEEVLPASSR